MRDFERTMVLSDWKKDLFKNLWRYPWGKRLRTPDYWSLINHVLDRITLPSCQIWIGHSHADYRGIPLCWAATRERVLLYECYKPRVQKMKEFPVIQSELLRLIPGVATKGEFNPYLELQR